MRPGKPIWSAEEDAGTIYGIIELLKESPATCCEIEMTQHIDVRTRKRLCNELASEGRIERVGNVWQLARCSA
jgi:hypothetical protein